MIEKHVEITETGILSFLELVIGMTKEECVGVLRLKGISYKYGCTKEFVAFYIGNDPRINVLASFDAHDRLIEFSVTEICKADIDIKEAYEKTKEKITKIHRPEILVRPYGENVALHFDVRNSIVDIQLFLSESSGYKILCLCVRMNEEVYSDWRNKILNTDALFSNYCDLISSRSLPNNNDLKQSRVYNSFFKYIKWQHVAVLLFFLFLIVYALNTRYEVYKTRRIDKWFGTIEYLEKIDNKPSKESKYQKSLYDALTKYGYDLGTFDSFSKNVSDETKHKTLHETITRDNWDVGDYDSFSKNLGF